MRNPSPQKSVVATSNTEKELCAVLDSIAQKMGCPTRAEVRRMLEFLGGYVSSETTRNTQEEDKARE